MPRYSLRCTQGHLTETIMSWDAFQAFNHVCALCESEARVVITSPPEIQADTVLTQDYTQMAGPIAKTWRTRKDRDAWLEKEQRWIPSADHPEMRAAFQQLEHRTEERKAIEAKGERWQDVERDRAECAAREKEADLKSKGITLEKLSFKDVQKRLTESREMAPQSGYTPEETSKWYDDPMQNLSRADGNVVSPENDWPDIPVSEALKEMVDA